MIWLDQRRNCTRELIGKTRSGNKQISLKFLHMPSAIGAWDVIGSSGVVCIHAIYLPDNRLLCIERPHEDPVSDRLSMHAVY